MPHELDFTATSIAEALEEIKDEDAIWGVITHEMRRQLRELLEGVMEYERDRLVACDWKQRSEARRDERAGYRSRSLVTALGRITGLRVPRMRRKRFRTKLWAYYRRRIAPIDRAIMESFVCGIATRKVKRSLRSILGNGAPSHQAVSRIVARLNESLKEWQRRPIKDDIEILYLDGVFLRIKERGIKKRPTLFAMGITRDRKVRILGFQHAWQETADEWQAFVQSLFDRGLRGRHLKVVVADESSSIASAVGLLWPEAALQVCIFHKMKNLVKNLKGCPLKRLIINDARSIWRSRSKAEALRRIAFLRNKWAKSHPRAVRNLLRDIDLTLTYFSLPRSLWIRARTTNPLDRFFREVKRRVDPIGAFVDRASASRILFAIADLYNQDQIKKENKATRAPQRKSPKNNFRTLLVA
jgi:transposase-like protein